MQNGEDRLDLKEIFAGLANVMALQIVHDGCRLSKDPVFVARMQEKVSGISDRFKAGDVDALTFQQEFMDCALEVAEHLDAQMADIDAQLAEAVPARRFDIK